MSQIGIFRRPVFTHLPNPIYIRLVGYVLTLAVHGSTVLQMTSRYTGDLLKDPDVDHFTKYRFRLLTIWNLLAQILYACLGLSCDALTLASEDKPSNLLNTLKKIREVMFSSVVLPTTLAVFTYFWAIYYYEPTIILPPGVVKTLLPSENFGIHTAIVPVALWEVFTRPRRAPASHLLNLAVLSAYCWTYIAVLFITFCETNKFMYPLLSMVYGTPYMVIVLLICYISNASLYMLQWKITAFLWGNASKEAKKIK